MKKKVSQKREGLKNDIASKKLFFILLLIILIAFFSSLLTAFFFFKAHVLEVRTIDYSFNVTDKVVGLNVNTSYLAFGQVPKNGFSKRTIVITPKKDSKLFIRAYGNGSQYLFFNNSISLIANNPFNLSITVFAPNKTGFFKGYLELTFLPTD